MPVGQTTLLAPIYSLVNKRLSISLSLPLIDEIIPGLGVHFSQMDRDIGDSDGGGGGGGEDHLPSDSPPRDPLSGGRGFRPMHGGESDSDHQRRFFGQKRRSPGPLDVGSFAKHFVASVPKTATKANASWLLH